MPKTIMNLTRDVYDDDGELVDEIELEVTVAYTPPESDTWDTPGHDGDVDVEEAVESDTREKVELTDCEEDYIAKNIWNHLGDLKADNDYQDYLADQNTTEEYPF